jgi:HK97 family phage major capsid protein
VAELAEQGFVNPADMLLEAGKAARGGSRFVGPGASKDVVAHVAKGGSIGPDGEFLVAPGTAGEITVGGANKAGGQGLAATIEKALAEGTSSAGGYLVPVEISSEVLKAVRARVAVMRMLPTIVPVEKELDITSLSSGVAADYVAENARLPVSEPVFAQRALLKPKELGVLVPVSNRLLRDARVNPSLEATLESDMADALGFRGDFAFLEGLGVGNEPLGIRNITGKTPSPNLGANGASLTYDHILDLVAVLRNVPGAQFGRPGFIFHPRTLSTLEKLKDGEDRYLSDAGLLTKNASGTGGTLVGYPFQTTTYIPTDVEVGTSDDCSYIVFASDWNECWIGENQQLTIEASGDAMYSADGGVTQISAFQNRQTVYRAVTAHDIALRRPEFFSVMEGVRP